MLEKGKKYISIKTPEIFKLEESKRDDLGKTIYNITSRIYAEFNKQQEEFIIKHITKIGEEYGIAFSFDKEKIADALKKRTKKAVNITDAYPHKAYCPSCYMNLCLNVEAIRDTKHVPSYCSMCGQYLDWSDIHR